MFDNHCHKQGEYCEVCESYIPTQQEKEEMNREWIERDNKAKLLKQMQFAEVKIHPWY